MTSPANATSKGGTRQYRHPVTGQRLPSVTTILGAALAKPALMFWAAKEAATYAADNLELLGELDREARIDLVKTAHRRSSDAKADLGSAVHATVDAWVKDQPMPQWDASTEPFMRGFVDFLEACEPRFLETECTVWNATVGYAGTADMVCAINGETWLLDIKTGKAVYPETALQLVAYGHGETILRDDGTDAVLPHIDRYGVLHLRPRTWALYPLEVTERTWEQFCAAVRVAEFVREDADRMVGAPIAKKSAA